MFIQIQLLNGFKKSLTYSVPPALLDSTRLGTIVRIPLKNRTTLAVVTHISHEEQHTAYTIRSIAGIESFPADAHYYAFLQHLSSYYQTIPTQWIKRLKKFLAHKQVPTLDMPAEHSRMHTTITLTDEQQAVYDFCAPAVINGTYTPTVLHGVTASGKTEVYKQLIMTALQHGKSALLLLPEVTLALRFETLLQQQLPAHIPIYSFHSAASTAHKNALWQGLLQQQPMLIIGVHLPVLLPIANLGLIVVDEEHEVGYQEKKHPKINSKEAAIVKAKLANIPIVLGSATPSVSSLYNVKTRGWHFFQLKKRFGGALPTIQTVILTAQQQRRKNFWISNELERAIAQRLQRKEQVILFINRRGYSFFVQCKACSFVFSCTHCSVTLTLHEGDTLTCHYCTYSQQQPVNCPQCTAHHTQFIKKGIGTQQVVTIVQQLFATARIARADLDTSSKKTAWQKTVAEFQEGTIDILVGTQTIAKGFHFPNVTLVGIIWADLNIHFPVYNAGETALQQLIQVAGRAGRCSAQSHVIVQAMSNHTLFNYLNEVDYLTFYTQEIHNRTEVGYPPAQRLVEIELRHTNPQIVDDEAYRLSQALRTHADTTVRILGPTKPPIHMINNVHTRKIYCKSSRIDTIITAYAAINTAQYKSTIFFTPNPVA